MTSATIDTTANTSEMVSVLTDRGWALVPLAEATDQFAWHRKPAGWAGAPCPVCGCEAKRLRAAHRALKADEIYRCHGEVVLWEKSVSVCFGTTSDVRPILLGAKS